jgi:MFS transporter, putative metabolite:H+ symporter
VTLNATDQISQELVSARIERLPLSKWHVKMMSIAGVAHFSDAFDSLAIAFVLPVLVGLWGISPAEIGFLISGGYVGQMLGAILFGWVAEKYGRRGSLRWTIVVVSLFSLACALSWNYASFLVFRTIQGLGLGGEVPVAATYMNEVSAARFRGRIVLLLQSCFAIGIVITSLISIWIVPHLGWQWMFYIGALPAILALFMRQLLPESPRWLAQKGHLKEADALLNQIEAEVTSDGKTPLPALPTQLPPIAAKTSSLASLFEGQYAVRTITLWSLMFCTSIVGYGLLTWMPTIYRTVLKVPVTEALQYGLLASVASLLGVWTGAFLVDAIGRRPAFMLGFFGSAVPLLVLWWLSLQASTIFIVAMASLGLYAISILLSGLYLYVPELYPTRIRAFATGVASAWLRIGAIVGPTMVGWILSVSNLASVFLSFAIAGIVGGLIILVGATETRGRALEQIAP